MAFGAPDTKEEADQQYDVTNPASALNARETAALDQMEAGLNDNEKTDDINSASNSLNDREFAAAKNGFYESSKGQSGNKTPLYSKILTKKKAGVFSIIALLVGGGGIMAGFFGPATMLINLHDNLIGTNDSLGPSYERRFRNVFKNMTSENSTICNSKKVRCRMSTLSYKALNNLSKHGIRPLDENGKIIDTKQKGRPDKKPARYEFDDLDNPGKTKTVSANDLDGFLKSKGNYKYASKIYGRYGAFKLRTKAWTGKHIKKLYNRLGISRAGGIIKEKIDTKKGKLSEKISEVRTKFLSKKLNLEAGNRTIGILRKFIKSFNSKSSLGAGIQYKAAVGSCMATKAPKMVTMAATAVQIAQIAPYIMDFVLSPGSKAKAAGFGSGFTADDMNVAGTILTEKVPRKSDGKKTSVLDSKYLLQALGINKKRLGKSKFTPGHNDGLSSLVADAAKIIDDTPVDEGCDFLLSPQGYYSAVAVNQVINAAATATVAGIVVKIGAEMIIDKGVQLVIDTVADKILPAFSGIIQDGMKLLFENSDLTGAKGEELGDALGISASVFFSSGNMHGGLSTLTTDQVHAFNEIKRENEEFNKQLEIASLSPFDTSSKYTFLGSLLYNTRQMMLSEGSYNGSASSIVNNILKLPSYALAFGTTAKASTNSDMSCDYADTYGFKNTDKGKVPAVNMAGMPCTGLTPVQANMSTNEALTLLEESGWIDTSKEDSLSESADIEEMIQSGYIKEGEVLYDFIQSCNDATNAQFTLGVAGCTVPDDASDKQFAAMSVFLIDYTLAQTINGENEEPEEATGAQVATTDDIVKAGEMFFDYTYFWGGHFHGSVDEMKNTINEIKNGSRAKGTMLTDCSGFVRASIYAAKGFDIEASYTGAYSSYVGKTLDEVSKDNLKPGDIAWAEGHVEIVTKVEGGQIYTQGARGPHNGGPIGGPSVMGGWTNYYRAKV